MVTLGFNKKLPIADGIVVIPVDDKFTMVSKCRDDEDIISEDTIHGKLLFRVNKPCAEMPEINTSK